MLAAPPDTGRDDDPRRVVADRAERAVLGALMLTTDPDLFVAVTAVVTPAHFYRPIHTAIMAAIVGQFGDDLDTNALSIADRMVTADPLAFRRGGGPAYLADCMAEAIPAQAVYHAGIIARDHARRGNLVAATRIHQAALVGDLDAYRGLLAAAAETAAAADPGDTTMRDGGAFVFDAPPVPTAVWGTGDTVLWAQGEALMICGPAGVGKTTLAVQIVAARLGLSGRVLDLPVQAGRRVLYLAMDRPPQISRAMRRLFRPDQREHLAEHLVVRGGPPPADFARHPDTLLRLCRQVGADTVVVDSIKDSTIGLASDEVGAGYNAARQRALAGGVEVLELHHQRKANGDNKQPDKLADVYGSTWITAGAGSVVMLWGEAGDPIVALSHLKQPAEPVGPLMVLHDHVAGTSAIYHQTDLLSATRSQGAVGMNALIAAKLLFTTDTPTASEREKARRKLDAMVRAGLLVLVAGSSGGAAGGTAGAYFLAERNR